MRQAGVAVWHGYSGDKRLEDFTTWPIIECQNMEHDLATRQGGTRVTLEGDLPRPPSS
jgi:hypothetical protein